MDALTNSERVLHGSLYGLPFVTGLVDAGSYVAMGARPHGQHDRQYRFPGLSFGGVPGLSIARSATALGFALVGGCLAGRL